VTDRRTDPILGLIKAASVYVVLRCSRMIIINNNALVTLVFPMKNPRAMRPLIKIFLTTCYCYYYCLNNYRIHISFTDGTLSEVMTIF